MAGTPISARAAHDLLDTTIQELPEGALLRSADWPYSLSVGRAHQLVTAAEQITARPVGGGTSELRMTKTDGTDRIVYVRRHEA